MTRQAVTIVYDGDCPFCSRYVHMARLTDNFDVELIDARTSPVTVARYKDLGIDLNEGMVIELEDRLFFGAEAAWLLARLTKPEGLWNRLVTGTLASRSRARWCYPVLRLGRNISLMALGRRPI